MAVAYLLERDAVGSDKQLRKVIDERLLVNVFDKKTLTPFDGGYLETYIEHDLKEIKVAKSDDEYRVIAKLSNGKTVQYQ